MASAQLSSPRRAGADSDLRERESARRPWSPARGAAGGAQGRGSAWPPRRRTTRSWAGWYNRTAPAPKPSPASLPAALCQCPRLRRARQGPLTAPTTHPREGGAVQCVPGVNFPVAPPQSRVQHGCMVPGLESGSQTGTGLQATQKLRPSWGSQGPRPGAELEPAQCPGHSVDAPSCSLRSLRACQPPYQTSKG